MAETEEMQELLGYLKNIKSYERDHIKSERSTLAMIWGLFIVMGGFLDAYLSVFLGYSPHGGVWFVVIAGALIAQQIISTQPLLYDENFTDEVQRENVSLSEFIIIVIIMSLTYPIGFVNTAYVMPYIGFSFGLLNVVAQIRVGIKSLKAMLPSLSFFLSAIVGFGAYLIDPAYGIYSGFIFGIIVGLSSFYTGYLSRKELVSA